MTLVWPNGTNAEPARSDGYGPRPSIETKAGPTRPFHVGTDHVGVGKVRSIGDGTVIESGKYDHVAWAGYQILIYLGEIDEVRTWVRMCHFQGHPPQSRGDTVRMGDFVGLEGSTGQSTGDHVHWEIYRGRVDRGSWGNPGTTVDPREFVLAHLNETPDPGEEEDEEMASKKKGVCHTQAGVQTVVIGETFSGWKFKYTTRATSGRNPENEKWAAEFETGDFIVVTDRSMLDQWEQSLDAVRQGK